MAPYIDQQTSSSGQVSHHAHVVRFYQDDRVLIHEWADSIGTALACGSAVVLIAMAEHKEKLLRRVESFGIAVGDVMLAERLIAIDAEDTLAEIFADERIDARKLNARAYGIISRAAAAAHDGRVVAFGELVALLCAAGHVKAAIELEKLWNALAIELRFTVRCAYPVQQFRSLNRAEVFSQICAEHTAVTID